MVKTLTFRKRVEVRDMNIKFFERFLTTMRISFHKVLSSDLKFSDFDQTIPTTGESLVPITALSDDINFLGRLVMCCVRSDSPLSKQTALLNYVNCERCF